MNDSPSEDDKRPSEEQLDKTIDVEEQTQLVSLGNAPVDKTTMNTGSGLSDAITVAQDHPLGEPGPDDHRTIIDNVRQTSASHKSPRMPTHLGRYEIRGVLGSGHFGVVYAGTDPELKRDVAIKVPLPDRVNSPENRERYLAEARNLALLDHPHVVPVYDVGTTPDGVCYVVSKLVVGPDLSVALAAARPTAAQTVELVRQIAKALHHAHARGLVHRDIKPSNILMLTEDASTAPAADFWTRRPRALVADFGLAIRDTDFAQGPTFCGTPIYMSPEQARGEGHRVDGRSDIYSLGVILYELLVGKRPYRFTTMAELLKQIVQGNLTSPKQLNPTIARELDRICMKALARRAADRYAKAGDLAHDLRYALRRKKRRSVEFISPPIIRADSIDTSPLSGSGSGSGVGSGGSLLETRAEDESPIRVSVSASAGNFSQPVKVVPRGLRAFDESDAHRFLELVPGPRDRHGIPDSIRFWKDRVEQLDPDKTFTVGLLYGPSGCGKSSLIKAGLLPRLSPHVVAVYLEASPGDTEQQLLRRLQRLLNIPDELENESTPGQPRSLAETIAEIRRGQWLAEGKKLLLVLDQFEQWLHVHQDDDTGDLCRALRQCDGRRVQALLMVRDDFGMAATRFLRALEVPIVEGQNFATCDLFDQRHARRVLELFGRAYGRLGDLHTDTPGTGVLTKEQGEFLDQVVASLAEEGKVISVRLALFAEMVKDRDWVPETLTAVGGVKGLGTTFLEETFSARHASPLCRMLEEGARAALKSLLPAADTVIKGHRRSREELATAVEGHIRPGEFEELLRLLDKTLRLITPAERSGEETARERVQISAPAGTDKASSAESAQYFQLTHDYLVPSIREWVARKQRETRHGRAEMQLEDYSAHWLARPESRLLPPFGTWLRVLALTRASQWSPGERAMMRAARSKHLATAALVSGVLLIVAGLTMMARSSMQAELARAKSESQRKQSATMVAGIVSHDPEGLRVWLPQTSQLRESSLELLWLKFRDPESTPHARLRAALALLELDERAAPDNSSLAASVPAEARDPSVWEYVTAELSEVPRNEWRNVIQALGLHREPAVARLREMYRAALPGSDAGHRCASALLLLGDSSAAGEELKFSPDPTRRMNFIRRLHELDGSVAAIAENLPLNSDAATRSGICCALGFWNDLQRRPAEQEIASRIVEDVYHTAPDGATHSAARWLLTRWGRELPAIAPSRDPAGERQWYVNQQGHAMLMVAPGKFQQGGSRPGAPNQREVTITRGFLVADAETSVDQYQRFMEDADVAAEDKPDLERWNRERVEGDGELPVTGLEWASAVSYCNWLSVREGLQPCYSLAGETLRIRDPYPEAGERELSEVGLDVALWKCDFTNSGYRLPTEAEWEFASRAGAETRWNFGNDAENIADHAVFVSQFGRKPAKVRQKMPQGLGLFDVYGNAWEWCWDWFHKFELGDPLPGVSGLRPRPATDPTGPAIQPPNPMSAERILRGGASLSAIPEADIDLRRPTFPVKPYQGAGFRVVRSSPESPLRPLSPAESGPE